ncbi:hypothetical protein ACVJ5M_007604 [Bradyrhizobium sp. S3.7.6]
MVEPELGQAGVEGAADRIGAEILVPDLGRDMQLAARQPGRGERGTDRFFVGVHLGGVDVAIADRQCALDRRAAGIALHAESAKAELGHADALCLQMIHELTPDVFQPPNTRWGRKGRLFGD